MLRHFNHPCSRLCGPWLPSTVSIRERNRFQGKKSKNFDTVKWEHQNVPLQPHEDFEPDEWLPRRLTYYPEGLWSSLRPRPRPPWYVDRRKPISIETPQKPEKEWNEEAIYPEIIKDQTITHFYKTSFLNRTKWYKELSKIPEIDERNLDIAKITRLVLHFKKPFFDVYNGLEMAQNLTRTVLVDGSLPTSYGIDDVDDSLVQQLTPLLLDIVRVSKFHPERARRGYSSFGTFVSETHWSDRVVENNILQEVNNACSNLLISRSPHILSLQTDLEANVRSWWYSSQLPLPSMVPILWRELKHEKIDQAITYDCANPLQVRTSNPLPRVVSGDDDLSLNSEIPDLTYHPTRLGLSLKSRYLISIPGFWPKRNHDPAIDEPNDFPFLLMFGRHDLAQRKEINYGQDFKDDLDVIRTKAILGSFAWLNSLAFNHGFTPFHETSYPFVNQGLITDGQNWHFFVYQMNSHTFHSDLFEGKGPKNICWISPELKLFDSYQDGSFVGVNNDVAKHLIKMYSKVPCKEPDVHYRPLVGKDSRDAEAIDKTRKTLGSRLNNLHERSMFSYKMARYKTLYQKVFVDHPDYDDKMMRKAIRPPLRPAEDYYYRWKY